MGISIAGTPTRSGLAVLFALLALYGCWSVPSLAARWGVSPPGIALLIGWAALAGWTLASAVRNPTRAEWAVFTAAALALRLASGALAAGRVSPGDPHYYLVLAHNLLAGRGLVMWELYMRLAARALYPPLYPLLLAGWGAVAGFAPASLLALSTLIDGAAAWLIWRLGTRLGQARAGLAAGALYLIWPSTLFSAPLAQKEGLETLLILALALAWTTAERVDWRAAARIGGLAGLLALTQPGQVALAALLAVAALPRLGWRGVLALGVRAGAVAAVAMLPWWLRNWAMFGAFVPLTSAGGLSLWIGENPGATGTWMPYPAVLAGLPELAYARAAGRIATGWMARHPGDVMSLNAAKFARAAGVGQFGLVRLAAMRPTLSARASATLLPLAQGAHLLMLAGGSLALAARRVPPRLIALASACVAQLLLFGVWFEFGERHREFLTPFLLLAVAFAVRPRTARAAGASGRPAA